MELETFYGIYLACSDRSALAYEKILRGRFPVLCFDSACAARYAELQAAFVSSGLTRLAFSLMIAATALVHGLELATCNAADFTDIRELQVVDWSA